jgi:hypothetical protein
MNCTSESRLNGKPFCRAYGKYIFDPTFEDHYDCTVECIDCDKFIGYPIMSGDL